MLQLSRPVQGLQLLRWNKELPAAGAGDPLGLTLRLSARLSAELLHCITSITPRARYFAFFPWALDDYLRNEKGVTGDRGRIQGVLARERAMVLGAVHHHGGETCDGGRLGGSDQAQAVIEATPTGSFDLDAWTHLNSSEGQFSAAYKASLINLGLFRTEEDEAEDVDEEVDPETGELDEEAQKREVTELSERGKRLAEAFGRSVRSTRYVGEGWCCRSTVPFDVLGEFGSRAGLCEIGKPEAEDRAILREVLFSCDRESTRSAHYRRRMTLLFMLESIRQLGDIGVRFDETSFRDLTYFREVMTNEAARPIVRIDLPETVHDIAERWRVFHFHGYLTLALQSLLVGIVRGLRHQPAGVERSQLLDPFEGSSIDARYSELFDCTLPKCFLEMTASETLGVAGISVEDALRSGEAELTPLSLDGVFGERQIGEYLLEGGEANQVSGLALATQLLYSVLLRYQATLAANYDDWYKNHVLDTFADVSVPGVLGSLRSDGGDGWWQWSNRDVLDRVNWRFVVTQHETMSYERGFAGGSSLFRLDGTRVIGAETDFTDPSSGNPRFLSAVRILKDLELVDEDDDGLPLITEEGRDWLEVELDREIRR